MLENYHMYVFEVTEYNEIFENIYSVLLSCYDVILGGNLLNIHTNVSNFSGADTKFAL